MSNLTVGLFIVIVFVVLGTTILMLPLKFPVSIVLIGLGIILLFAANFAHWKKNLKKEWRFGMAVLAISIIFLFDSTAAVFSGNNFASLSWPIDAIVVMFVALYLAGLKIVINEPEKTGSDDFYVYIYECVRGKSLSNNPSL